MTCAYRNWGNDEPGLDKEVKNTKEPEQAIKMSKPNEEILNRQKWQIINIVGKQAQLLKRFKESERFFKTMGLSLSTIYYKIWLFKFFGPVPTFKKFYPGI